MSFHEVDLAIIGAGVTGCYVAQRMHARGVRCVLLEKSRGVGGRCSTRYLDDGSSVNLGTAFIQTPDTSSEALRKPINQWQRSGLLQPVSYLSRSFNNEQTHRVTGLSAMPVMNAWLKALVADVPCVFGKPVACLLRDDTGQYWHLLDDDAQRIVQAKALLLTMPCEQAEALLATCQTQHVITPFMQKAYSQWVCTVDITTPPQTDASMISDDHPVLMLARKESDTKQSDVSRWTLLSTYDWAAKHQNLSTDKAAKQMTQAFLDALGTVTGSVSDYTIKTVHFWRYASYPDAMSKSRYLWLHDNKLGVCGDWLNEGGVLGALDSAVGFADAVTDAMVAL